MVDHQSVQTWFFEHDPPGTEIDYRNRVSELIRYLEEQISLDELIDALEVVETGDWPMADLTPHQLIILDEMGISEFEIAFPRLCDWLANSSRGTQFSRKTIRTWFAHYIHRNIVTYDTPSGQQRRRVDFLSRQFRSNQSPIHLPENVHTILDGHYAMRRLQRDLGAIKLTHRIDNLASDKEISRLKKEIQIRERHISAYQARLNRALSEIRERDQVARGNRTPLRHLFITLLVATLIALITQNDAAIRRKLEGKK